MKHLRPHRSTESSSSRRSHKHRHKRRHHHRSSKHSSAHHSRHHGDDAGSQSRAPKGKHGSHTYGMAIAPLIWGSSQGGGASSGARGSTGVTHHAGDSGVASDNLLAPPMGAIEMKVPHASVAMTPRARAGTDFVPACRTHPRQCSRRWTQASGHLWHLSEWNRRHTPMSWVVIGVCGTSGTTRMHTLTASMPATAPPWDGPMDTTCYPLANATTMSPTIQSGRPSANRSPCSPHGITTSKGLLRVTANVASVRSAKVSADQFWHQHTHVSFDDLLSASPTFPKPRRRLLNTPCQHCTAHAWSDSASRADLDLACAKAASLVFWSARHSPGRWVLWSRLLGLRICTDS